MKIEEFGKYKVISVFIWKLEKDSQAQLHIQIDGILQIMRRAKIFFSFHYEKFWSLEVIFI